MNLAKTLKRISWLFLALAVTACKPVVLSPSGDVAAQQRDLLVISTLLMLVIIIPVMLMTGLFAWHYRAKNKDATYEPDWDHSTKLELVIWAIPLLIIITLGALTWVGTHLLDPYRPLQIETATHLDGTPQEVVAKEPLQVQVVALDWKWLFIYPEYNVASVNEMAAPVDRPIEFTLTSSTVMNAFYIPAMAGMIYAMPGMETKLHGVFNEPGDYHGIASHYSGAGFSGMNFTAMARDQAGFDEWIAKLEDSDQTLDRARYLELEKPTENVDPMAFSRVDPQLFQRAVNMCVEEGKMCMAEMMARDRAGGMGLEGTVNVQALTYDKYERRGTARPVLGWDPFQVAGICTVDELEQMFAASQRKKVTPLRDPTPLRSRALPQPEGIFKQTTPNDFTQTAPDAGVDRNL
ncbi:ubiquinol oxidase subunit II [Paracoccus fistulariae]|uniref:Ubiquinol oxidase polypeptide II n=1 Tax=Paracoccus fistulariae TaxID=658446 RepID=A0ABY7SPB8_9RHOB|nr:ubiquinol oxidase subunit II [Paracoccus fistulariae]WCR08725.1 ubiquinol oxidase subunit II [Paracoccus fistulariae]